MQSVAFKLEWLRGLLIAALYVSVFGCATAPTSTPTTAAPSPAAGAPARGAASTPAAPAQPAVVTGVVSEQAPIVVPLATGAGPAENHIALILPLKSATFGKAAEAVQQGFLAAALQVKGLPVRVYPCNDEKTEVVALYQQALKAGAVAVAGPLTRNGVTALAANPDLAVPTLALNVIEATRTDQLYFFGLPAEQEARQVAQWSTKIGLLSATIVRTDTALSKRLAQAFAESWQHAGGIIQSEIVYAGDPAPLRLIPSEPGSMVFLAAEVDKARLLRPYISNALPIYATSQVFTGNANNNLVNFDLAEVRFVDMPWLLLPDHPAVMVYPRVTPALPQDMERLYALGIDAYRLLQVFYQHDTLNAMPLDGVTGKLSLNEHVLERDGIHAVLRQGLGMPLEGRPPQAEGKPQQ